MPSDKIVHNDVEQQTSQEHIAEIFCSGNILSTTFSSQIIDELKDVDDLQQVISILKVKVGDNILQSKQLFNVINDLTKVFREFPQYKFIVKGVFDWQIFNINLLKVITPEKLLNEANKFSQKTGFSQNLVIEIFYAIGKGLGNKNLGDLNDYFNFIQNEQLKVTDNIIEDVDVNSSCVLENKFQQQIDWSFIDSEVEQIKVSHEPTNLQEINFIAQKIYTIPEWNACYAIDFKDFNISNFQIFRRYKNIVQFNLRFKFLGKKNTVLENQETIPVFLFIFLKNGQLAEKRLLTRINVYEKFSISQGNIKVDFRLDSFGAILIVPMWNGISSNENEKKGTFIGEKFSGVITVEPNTSKNKLSHLILNTPVIYGKDKKCTVYFTVEGITERTYFYGDFDIAFFNSLNELIDCKKIYISSAKYVYTSSHWNVKYIVFKEIDNLFHDFSDISKIVFSES